MQTLIVEADKTTVLPVFKNPDGSFEVIYENFTRTLRTLSKAEYS